MMPKLARRSKFGTALMVRSTEHAKRLSRQDAFSELSRRMMYVVSDLNIDANSLQKCACTKTRTIAEPFVEIRNGTLKFV